MTALPVVLIAALLLVLIRQTRALIGRHRVQAGPVILRLATALGFVALFLGALLPEPSIALAGTAGALTGAALGWLALRLTAFEDTGTALFYRPNPYIGLGVIGVWVARLAIRLAALAPVLAAGSMAGAGAGDGFARSSSAFTQLANDPLTAAVTLVVWGFYAVYAAGLLLRLRTAHAV